MKHKPAHYSRVYWQILRMGSIATLALALVACNSLKQKESRGYVASAPIADQIAVGKTSREEVQRLLGSPSTISDFPPETWYYITRERETVAFFSPKLVGQKVVQIEFDDAGKVSVLNTLGKDASRKVQYVNRKTPTEGRELGIAEQLLGNIGRFNTPRDSTEARQ